MSAFSVMVAAPGIQSEFGASAAQISAIVAGYAVAYAAALIPGSRLGDIVGRRRMFAFGMLTFGAMACLCAAAPTIWWLIAARTLQGFAAAAAFPQVLTIIRLQAGDEQAQARAFAAFGVALGVSGITGQVLSGAMIDGDFAGLGWRGIFLVNPIVAVVACLIVWREIPETKVSPAPRLDGCGAVLSSLGFGLLLAAALLASRNLASAGGVALAALVLLAMFAHRQIRLSRDDGHPLVPVTLFQSRFGWALAAAGLFHTTVVAFPLTMTIFLQAGLGQSAWMAGLFGLPVTIAFLCASSLSERVLRVWPLYRVMICGGALTAFGLAVCAGTGLLATPAFLIGPLLVVGWGQGWFLPLLLNAALSELRPTLAGAGSGLLATMQQLGGGFGAAAANGVYFYLAPGSSTAGMAFVLATLIPTIAALSAVALLPKPAKG
jgi:MFS family permease